MSRSDEVMKQDSPIEGNVTLITQNKSVACGFTLGKGESMSSVWSSLNWHMNAL
jgi:hypothetical protein